MIFDPNSLALLLLCSQLALDDDANKPLTLHEWNPLVRRMQIANLQPADLLELPSADLKTKLGITIDEAVHIRALLARTGNLTMVVEHLASSGIYPLTRADAEYPKRFRARLKDSAPPVLFYAGEKALLGQPGIAVVGSRHLDEAGQACAEFVGNACGLSGQVLYSGGAKGVDTISMNAALVARGTVVGVLADSLVKVVLGYKDALQRGDLCLITPYSPDAGFTVGAAMGRNRLIYCLADYAIVVASDAETGGTWAGATETLKKGWVPVFVLDHEMMPEGNKLLLQRGALSFPHPFRESPIQLPHWLKESAGNRPDRSEQPSLF